jgi:hypothetical protein
MIVIGESDTAASRRLQLPRNVEGCDVFAERRDVVEESGQCCPHLDPVVAIESAEFWGCGAIYLNDDVPLMPVT